METDELPILDPNVDFRQVPPIHQKRTIAFINHFIIRTVSFLNTFAASCESRLMALESKLQGVEASLLILESQLSSISWLDDKTNISTIEISNSAIVENDDLILPEVEIDTTNDVVDTTSSQSGPKACEDSRFIRFFKMVQFGVPPAAVKLKMKAEGLDPSVLDTPNSVIAGYDTAVNMDHSSTDSNSS